MAESTRREHPAVLCLPYYSVDLPLVGKLTYIVKVQSYGNWNLVASLKPFLPRSRSYGQARISGKWYRIGYFMSFHSPIGLWACQNSSSILETLLIYWWRIGLNVPAFPVTFPRDRPNHIKNESKLRSRTRTGDALCSVFSQSTAISRDIGRSLCVAPFIELLSHPSLRRGTCYSIQIAFQVPCFWTKLHHR